MSATLGTSNDQTLVHEPYCLQTDHLSQNGTNANQGVCKTLDTQTPPAVVCMTDTQPNAKISGETCVTLTSRMHKDPPVICMADDNGKSAVEENLCGTLKVGGGGADVCAECTGPLCARDFKGVGSQYVAEGKVVAEWVG